MNEYSTLSKLRTFLALASQNTSNDTELRDFLNFSSRAIDRATNRHFYPERHGGTNTLKFDLPMDGQNLRIDNQDILAVHGLSDLNGASEVDSSVYWLKTGDDWNMTPYSRIVLDHSKGSILNFSGTDQRAIHVDAVVGYHEHYGTDGWIDSGGSLTDALGAANTLASVSASNAVDSRGISPRFEQGQIWRLGSGASEEYAYVQDTTDGGNVRLIRGINGTSAAAQAASETIWVWNPEPDIAYSAMELAAFLYQKSKSPFTDRVAALNLGLYEMPESWPVITQSRIKRFKKRRVYSF